MTKVKKEETDMQSATTVNQVPPLPLPQNEEKRLMQAEVNLDLFNAVHREMKRGDLKIRQVMEWGLKAFLLKANPKEAARLGIKTEDKP
jgi:hypothetical protein